MSHLPDQARCQLRLCIMEKSRQVYSMTATNHSWHCGSKLSKNRKALADSYECILAGHSFGQPKEYYNHVRDEFNRTHRPEYLLFLLVRCVKAAVRYNAEGHFNQSPDNRRSGTKPDKMRKQLIQVAEIMADKTKIASRDYREIIDQIEPNDIVYIDPPYQGVVRSGDPRYYEGVSFIEVVDILENLNRKQIPFIMSYDGRTGAKAHGYSLPLSLGLQHLELDAGRSSQATLLGKSSRTYESLYLSPGLTG